ncbi:MAG: GDP-mannose 4,6-dehydratase [Candidatus Aminicenantia bacterium]
MRVLITGITGFAGSHLAEYILKEFPDLEVWGLVRWRSPLNNIMTIKDKLHLVEGDLKDYVSIREALRTSKPDRIFHLAAQSFVPTSWKLPAETFSINVIGQINLFEAVRDLGLNPLIHIAGSSEEYGLVYENEVPIKETNPLRPLSPYAVSKVAQDLLAFQYFQSYKLKIVRTRAFNHSGPRRGYVFVTSNFAMQIAMIEKGKQAPEIHVGDLTARRDFTDVRDVVKGYWLSLAKGEPGDIYNISSGKAYRISEVLEILLSYTKVNVKVVQDPERMRPSDVLLLVGDNTKFSTKTGWKPEIPFEKTLEDLLNWWRERV